MQRAHQQVANYKYWRSSRPFYFFLEYKLTILRPSWFNSFIQYLQAQAQAQAAQIVAQQLQQAQSQHVAQQVCRNYLIFIDTFDCYFIISNFEDSLEGSRTIEHIDESSGFHENSCWSY